MRKYAKKLITYYLFLLTRLVLILRKPTVIVIAGSTNKTLVKKAVVNKLKQKFVVRANPRQWNAELGLPLSILFIKIDKHSLAGWAVALGQAFLAIGQRNFPKYLVLELGFNRPGDMRFLYHLLKPQIAIITNAQPMYQENFNDDVNELITELRILMSLVLPPGGKIIINDSVLAILATKPIKNNKQVIKYSLTNKNNHQVDWQVTNIRVADNRQTFELSHQNQVVKTIKTKIPGQAPREAELIAEIIFNII